jgi:uncharacterized protein YhdP
MLRRHPFLSFLLLLFLALLCAAAIFVATFDLNRYCDQIQSKFSDLLHQSVHIGEAHLALLQGPSLEFKDLRIGSNEGENNVFRAGHLYLRFELDALLHGKISFSQILVASPRLTVVINPSGKAESPTSPPRAPSAKKGLLSTTLVRTLAIDDGTIRFIDRRNPQRPVTTTLENIQGRFSDISLKNPLRLQVSGALPQEQIPAAFSLSATVAPPADLADWHDVGLDLDLSLRDFLPQPVVQQYFGKGEMKAAGQLSVSLKVKGSPATGVKLNGQVDGKDFSLAFPSYYQNPFTVRNLGFAFTWTALEDQQCFEDLFLKIDDLQIGGNLALSRKNNSPWLEGTLFSSAISADRVLGFLPDQKATSPAAGLRNHIFGGTLSLDTASLDGPVSAFGRFDSSFPLREAKISLWGGTIRISPNTLLKEVAASLALTGNRITIKGGSARMEGFPLRFSGALDKLYQPDMALRLKTDGTLPAANLMALFPIKSPRNLTLGGNIPLKLEVVGTGDDFRVNLSANLNDLSFQLGKIVSKAAGRKGSLSLRGEITPQTLTLQKGRFQLPFLDLSANGTLARTGKRSFNLAFDTLHLDLLKIRAWVPVLKRFKARGKLSLHYALTGANGRIKNRQGKILLHDFGIHVVRTIADINHANGKILISGDRADLTDIVLKIGSSTLNVRGTIRDFNNPKFDLRVRGNAVHGEDLAFFSTDTVLRDFKAHLVIDRSHIIFEPATVKLDGGTDATVRGTISDFKAPKVRLDIESQHANIDEVIGLWHKPRPPENVQAPKRKTFVHITARVREGTLGELHYQNAEGVITSQQEVLTIHPLHFHAGKGVCTGQVVVDHTSGSPPLLKISGHLENFDAAAIYRDLLKRRSLVTGTLKGDFYLEGKAGKEFLPTSLGSFNMEVEKGVLRKFQFLSKVFSLLNVSQILTFQLPDMSLEGMPFNKLKGAFSLRRGVLSTEDLLVDSNAMNLSLVGNMDLKKQTLDLTLGVKPLQTVDKIVTNIPLAGWILAGKEKALITIYFHIKGKSEDPEVIPIPITSLSKKILGIFRRVLQLPGKVITDMRKILGGGKSEKGK